ncbi:MAG: hypothetical protein AAFN70_21195, partial [Planctomycetota bacterium]
MMEATASAPGNNSAHQNGSAQYKNGSHPQPAARRAAVSLCEDEFGGSDPIHVDKNAPQLTGVDLPRMQAAVRELLAAVGEDIERD